MATPVRPVFNPARTLAAGSVAATHGALSLAVAFGVGAMLAVLGCAPAHWLAGPVAQATGGKVQLVNARGTVWKGQADLLLTGGLDSQDRAALPGGMQWQLNPTWEGLALALNAPCCTPRGVAVSLQPGWGTLRVNAPAHQSQWPAALLSGLGTPWNTLQLQGQLAIDTPGLSLEFGAQSVRSSGSATLDVRDAASRLSTVRPMGSYQLTWKSAGDGGRDATLSLTTREGALRLQGQGQWVAGRLRFEGDAQASPGREEALANLLNLLGRRQGARTLIKIG